MQAGKAKKAISADLYGELDRIVQCIRSWKQSTISAIERNPTLLHFV